MNSYQLKEDILEDIAYKLKYNNLSCKDLSDLSKAFSLVNKINIEQNENEELNE